MALKDENHVRCGGVIVNKNEILLIHRFKNGYEYYVFPGGGLEEGETHHECLIREVLEETSIEVAPIKLSMQFVDALRGYEEFYYLCKVIRNCPLKFTGPELDIADEKNTYEPIWVSLDELEKINLLPDLGCQFVRKSLDRIKDFCNEQ